MADKRLQQLIINKGTEAKFNALTEKSDEQLYFITDSNTYVTTDQGVDNAGKILTVGGDGKLSPTDAPTGVLPDQQNNANKYLVTDGVNASWTDELYTKNAVVIGKGNAAVKSGSSVCIGFQNTVTDMNGNVCIGTASVTSAQDSIAIGHTAKSQAKGAIQIGTGENTEANSLSIGFGNGTGNYKLLSSTGVIPTERLAANGTEGQVLAKSASGMAWVDVTIEDFVGIKGDYCSTYGIVDMQHGAITTPAEGNVLNIPGGIVLKLLGADSLITLASPQTYQVEATTDFTLFYTRKEDATAASFVEATEVYYSNEEPAPNGQTGAQAWKKSGDAKWQFRSNDTGNEWKEAIATPLCDIHFTGDHLTRIDFAGYRLMNTQDFARRDADNTFTGENAIKGESAELKFQSTVDIISSAPTSQKNYGITFKDKNGDLVGQYTVHHGTNNEVYSQILVKNPTSNQAAILNIGFNQSGTEYVDASAGVKQAIVEWGNAKYQAKDKRVTKLSAQSTDDEYPTAKCVYDLIGDVETLLHNINTGA